MLLGGYGDPRRGRGPLILGEVRLGPARSISSSCMAVMRPSLSAWPKKCIRNCLFCWVKKTVVAMSFSRYRNLCVQVATLALVAGAFESAKRAVHCGDLLLQLGLTLLQPCLALV